MSSPDADEITQARGAIVSALEHEFAKHGRGGFDPYAFGEEAAKLVNAFAALTIIEKDSEQPLQTGAASRSDD